LNKYAHFYIPLKFHTETYVIKKQQSVSIRVINIVQLIENIPCANINIDINQCTRARVIPDV